MPILTRFIRATPAQMMVMIAMTIAAAIMSILLSKSGTATTTVTGSFTDEFGSVTETATKQGPGSASLVLRISVLPKNLTGRSEGTFSRHQALQPQRH